ncbi:polymorphic toxin-type HINT domain-containing protein [Paenibacillus sp. S-12]|uniref:polymorphic toxin-type HINT domain-containing protein n=1 Tax=Paenibacillus sp. S-12 TaxID=3031371 RepID=UPI0025A0A748|nr:polymorphic toxin-type HINT domain-containing protein [Paenibacillus sp. S-12]
MIRWDPSGHNWVTNEWNTFVSDMKKIHSSWYSAADYWTMGSVSQINDYIKVSKEKPMSLEQWLKAAELFMEITPMKAANQGVKLSKKVNTVVKKAVKGCNCFTAGTKVQTDEGEKNIEDIEVGDRVLAKDENNPDGELAYKEVTGLYRNQRDDIIKLHVGEQLIETTDNHPFWVEGKGWVFADELQVGDKLQKADGSNLTIDNVESVKLDESVTVYNFTVADFHTYYVTNLGVWVHNTNCFNLNVKPSVSNSKLQNIVKDLYKGQNMPNLIGNGTTMDAIRYELITGQAVGGKFHSQKGKDYSRALEKLINSGNLNSKDRTAAQAIFNDLQKALAGK